MVAGTLSIISGLLLNQWFLEPITYLSDGQTSLLRIIFIWVFDITAVTQGLILLTKKKHLSITPKKILFRVMTLALILLFSESMLQVLARISPTLDQVIFNEIPPRKIPDKILGHRPNPNFFEHDSNGFRNNVALLSSKIVAIGDSQTYGTGVKPHQAWPQQLSKLSGQSVYNMAFGGYGSVEGLILLQTKAIQLNPTLVVFAMYDGNDLVDAYDAVYNLNLLNSLKSTDPLTKKTIATLQQQDPLIPKIKNLTAQMRGDTSDQKKKELTAPVRKKTMYFRIKQLKLSQLFFCLERTLQEIFVNAREYRWEKLAQSDSHDSDIFEIFQTKDFKTIFTPAYRGIALNLADPRVEEGLRITLDTFREMKKTASDHSIDFLVLMLPLKERVFYTLYPENGLNPSQAMQRIICQQDEIRKRTVNYLQQHEISYIDTLPILKSCFDRHQQPFFVDADGHLNPVGQKAVAEAVHEYIQNQKRK